MAKLTSKLGAWELDHVHMWRERSSQIRAERRPLIGRETEIATIGSCFAEELAGALARVGLGGGMHPGGLYYNSRSIRQELERMIDAWPAYDEIEPWSLGDGFVHPLKSYRAVYPDRESLGAWCAGIDRTAAELFSAADVVVVTLGLIEAWIDPESGAAFRQIPHPEIFERIPARFHRQSVEEIEGDLERILEIVRGWGADLIVTVSPIPLHATMTGLDVRVANTESKSRIRAAVSQFVERHPEVGYFHSYEMVATAESPAEFLLEDGRHVRRRAVDLIVHDFLQTFARDELEIAAVDSAWLAEPTQTAARPRAPMVRRVQRGVWRILGRS